MKMTLNAGLSCWVDSAESCCFAFLGPGVIPGTGELYTQEDTHGNNHTCVFYSDHRVHKYVCTVYRFVCVR